MPNQYTSSQNERYSKVMEERRLLVEKIIENMRQGYIVPKPLWDVSRSRMHNPVSHFYYKGANYIKLLMESVSRGYSDTRWMTYKQAQRNGFQVKKGAVGVALEKYVFEQERTVTRERRNEETGKIETVTEKMKVKLNRPVINHFTVFNAEQIDGLPPLEQTQGNADALELADQLIASSACPVMELPQNKAFYSRINDSITLPLREHFASSEAFATVLMHEMIHSTGHESRLNRPLSGKFGSPGYAKEELRAELGSFFMGTDYGVVESGQLLDSHTQYLESWIKVLEDDPNELFRACSDAQKAVDLLEKNLELEQEKSREQAVTNVRAADAQEWVQDKAAELIQSMELGLQQETPSFSNNPGNEDISLSQGSAMQEDYFKLFYAGVGGQGKEAAVYAAERGWHKIWASESLMSGGDTWVVYRESSDLPEFLREYAIKQETIQQKALLDSVNIIGLDENQHVEFSVKTEDGRLHQGTYRILADESGAENTVIAIEGEEQYPELKAYQSTVRDCLAEKTGFATLKQVSQEMNRKDAVLLEPASRVQYPDPVVQIIHSEMPHPMLEAGNQMTFVEANRLFASLNKQRELEVYMSNSMRDPLFYPTKYRLIYQENGEVMAAEDTYDIGADTNDLLEHIGQKYSAIHDAYVHLNMHVRLEQMKQGIEAEVWKVKQEIDMLKLSGSVMLDSQAEQKMHFAERELLYQKKLMETVNETKTALATGAEIPQMPQRESSLTEYLGERGLSDNRFHSTWNEKSLPQGLSKSTRNKLLGALREDEKAYYKERSLAVKEFKEKVKAGEIIEKPEEEQSQADIIRQQTELYVEQRTMTEETMVMEG